MDLDDSHLRRREHRRGRSSKWLVWIGGVLGVLLLAGVVMLVWLLALICLWGLLEIF